MKTFTNAVERTRKRIRFDLRTFGRSVITLALLTIATFAPAASCGDDSHYVSLGSSSGYSIVGPGSPLSRQLGVEHASTVDTSDPFNHGYGADALAFHFNRTPIRWCRHSFGLKTESNSSPRKSFRQSRVHNDGAVVGQMNNRQVTDNSAATRQASSVKTLEFPNL